MLVLGLNIGHDPSAALLDNRGAVLAAVHEARLTRFKKERRFPRLAVRSVFRATGREASEVEIVAYSSYEADSLLLIRDKFLSGVGDLRATARGLLEDELRKAGLHSAKLVRVDHHFAHASAAMLASATPDALIVTSDGYGDGLSFTVRRSRAGRVPKNAELTAPIDASLGLVYQYVTGGLGYSMLSEEWKVLGLEPYGNPVAAAELFEQLVHTGSGISTWNGRKLEPWSVKDAPWHEQAISDRTAALRRYMELNVHRFDRPDVASAVQDFVEKRLIRELENLGPQPGTSLALAGGTFLNVRLNRMLGELSWVADVAVFPAAGDGGNAVGAALAYLQQTSAVPPRLGIDNVYWGQQYVSSVEDACITLGLRTSPASESEIIGRLASAVAEGRVVGIVRGRSEFGPRALLNRSLICRADRPGLAAMLTSRLQRDPVMPYGCSMLSGEAETALVDATALSQCLRFMVGAPRVGHEFGRRYRPVCHQVREGGMSTRPHVVPDDGSWQARLLRAVGSRTGGAIVLNTSFNLHGEPIVESPADALLSFSTAAFPGSLLLLEDRILSLEEIERSGQRPAGLVSTAPAGERRRRKEACVCIIIGASAMTLPSLRKEIEQLGLSIAAERRVAPHKMLRVSRSIGKHWNSASGNRIMSEGHAFLVAGSESTSIINRWAARIAPHESIIVATPSCGLDACEQMQTFFPEELRQGLGSFADLLIRSRVSATRETLDVLARTSPAAFAGLIYELADLTRDFSPAEITITPQSDIAAIYGISVSAPEPSSGLMYLYAPEGFSALVSLVNSLDAYIREGNFLQCRQNGLVLAYMPHSAEPSTLEDEISRAMEWGIDALVAVSPRLRIEAAEVIEQIAISSDLAIIGGSDCTAVARRTRPLGIGRCHLDRFVNRFPGLEL